MIQAFIFGILPSGGLYARPSARAGLQREKRRCVLVHFHVDLNVHIHISANNTATRRP